MLPRRLDRPVGLTPLLESWRIRGSLLGLAVGDALGAPLEGWSAERAQDAVEHGLEMAGGGAWAPGEWTDDTAMALCLGESIVERGLLDTNDLAVRYIAWARTGKGIGRTTRAALRGAANDVDARARAEEFHRGTGLSAGNGTVMRATPIALAASSVEDARHAAHEDAILTHHDPAARMASAALCAALLASGEERDPVGAAAAEVGDHAKLNEVIGAVRERDASTIAALAAALLGCSHGPGSIPERWLAPLLERERIEHAAKALAEIAA